MIGAKMRDLMLGQQGFFCVTGGSQGHSQGFCGCGGAD